MGSGSVSQLKKLIAELDWKQANIGYHDGYIQLEERKKMGWFKRKFTQWCREAWEDSSRDAINSLNQSTVHLPNAPKTSPNAKTSIRFCIYPANGGYVLEHYKSGVHIDIEGPSLTIVPNGDSIGTAVEHVIMIESLKA
jgi:hypothetical protein